MSRYRQTISEALQQVNENSLIIKAKAIAKKFADSMTKAVAEIEKLEKGLSKNPAVDAELRKYNEEVSLDKNLNEFKKMTVSFKTHDMMSKASTDLAKQGFTISGNQKALKVNGNGADLNKYATDLQNNYGATVRAESYTIDESEDVSLDEASLKDIFTANQEGKKAEDIAKKLNMSVADVKKILGEETLHEFTDAQISQLKKEYEPLRGKTISGPNATKLMKIFDKFEKNKQLLVKILKADIPFVSMLAQARLIRVHGANSSQLAQMRKEEIEEIEEKAGVEIAKIRADRDEKDDKEVAAKEKENDSLKDQVAMLKTKLENEKNKAIKPEPNPKTGEVPLTIGIANKLIRDKEDKDAKKKEIKEEVAIVYTDKKTRQVVSKKFKSDAEARKWIKQFDGAAGQINFKPSSMLKNEDRRMYVEAIAALTKKADKSGMSYSILKQVYDRGMAAWKGGHRPGASQHQWAFARVNSFITKSSGTWGGADKDLAAKVKG